MYLNDFLSATKFTKFIFLLCVSSQNTIPGDVSAMTPGGIRMGTPALTTR